MRVSFIMLAHEPPEFLKPLICSLLEYGADIYLHYDASSPHDIFSASSSWELEKYDGNLYFSKRVAVSWGSWSIVQATLNSLLLAQEKSYKCDYLMLLSGSCFPIKPVSLLEDHLSEHPLDYIECVNGLENRWVTHGQQNERWLRYNLVSWHKHPRTFMLINKIQKDLGINRQLPLKHTPFFGSQWWCLRVQTIDRLLTLIKSTPQIARFYQRTWVPDELFFQTLVANCVAVEEICNKTLTKHAFNKRGAAKVLYNDDLPSLLLSDKFFARKISPFATDLIASLQLIANSKNSKR